MGVVSATGWVSWHTRVLGPFLVSCRLACFRSCRLAFFRSEGLAIRGDKGDVEVPRERVVATACCRQVESWEEVQELLESGNEAPRGVIPAVVTPCFCVSDRHRMLSLHFRGIAVVSARGSRESLCHGSLGHVGVLTACWCSGADCS